MTGERELLAGMLSKEGANFRVIVSGHVGVKEIERLIKKLEFDKEILADPAESQPDGGLAQDIATAPRDGREIRVYGRVAPTPDSPMVWVQGRFDEGIGWVSGDPNRLVIIHGPQLWRPLN